MIFIERDQTDEQGRPVRPSDEWFANASAATQLALEEGENHDAAASIYAVDEVRAALEKLFADKCAYCEQKAAGTHDWNVEHYRPKGRVIERPGHPGYYWLAYEWSNLFLSCQHCNQRRRGRPSWDDPTEGPAFGKGSHFPVQDEASRAMNPADDITRESALLIDPCNENPLSHVITDITGHAIAFNESPHGKASIKHYHLNRKTLRRARKEKIDSLIDALYILGRAREQDNTEAVSHLRGFIETRFLDSNCEFAGAARAVVMDSEELSR